MFWLKINCFASVAARYGPDGDRVVAVMVRTNPSMFGILYLYLGFRKSYMGSGVDREDFKRLYGPIKSQHVFLICIGKLLYCVFVFRALSHFNIEAH